ncbi:MAG: peptidylprolyl isomerase [Candidatus Falkowbacteria bacterium]
MKKVFFLAAVLLLAAGCGAVEKQNDTQITSINTNSTEQATSGDSETSNKNTMEQQAPASVNQKDFTDLTKEYSKAILKTNQGDIEVEFYNQDSPKTVNNFLNLAKRGFYTGTSFHRVIKDFMIQGGDPNSKDADRSTHGRGGPGYAFADEFNTHPLVKGSLAMANSGSDTNGSQFFIVTADATPWLDGKHTNFGKVIKGMDIVSKIETVQTDQNDHPIDDVIIEKIELLK